jgi:hypothetical protein
LILAVKQGLHFHASIKPVMRDWHVHATASELLSL